MRPIPPSRPNFFTGGTLDRASHRRPDDAWIEAARADPGSRFVLFWRGQALIGRDTPRAIYTARPQTETPWVFLGLSDDAPVFAANLSHIETPHEVADLQDGGFVELRGMAPVLTADDATILATGRAMLNWHQQARFCSVCGHPNQAIRGGYVMRCGHCGAEHFPRTDPVVIMLIARGGKLLLGQGVNFPPEWNMYSPLAGFVEPGESLEEAVRREAFEETGIRVGAAHYHSSQPWPFPASLMLGFFGEGLNDEIVLDETEMRDARWFSPAQLADRAAAGFNLPPEQSIARRLIEDWLASEG